jgi:uncharacterized damage-inducible protein DinB
MDLQPEPTLMEFARFNQWANQTLLAACAALEANVATSAIPGGYGSIHETFCHVLRAEASFLKRIHGARPEPGFKWEDRPSFEALAEYEGVLAEALLQTIETVQPTHNVHEAGNGWVFDYQARLIFMSIAYHGIAHRTDITTYLSARGVAVPELDVWAYQEAYPERFQAVVGKPTSDPP